MCNAMNGQCECADNVEGRTCDRCIPGSYGEPPASCMVSELYYEGILPTPLCVGLLL